MSVVPLHKMPVLTKPRVVGRRLKYIDRQILELMRRHKGYLLPFERLIFAGWGDRETGTRENLRQRVCTKLRPYLSEFYPNEEIVSISGEGYVLVDAGTQVKADDLQVVE